ncbi:hypothetical protein [Citrobacter koseri]|uniref:hypothetical protein n=1 Tax=Citrobacter koseri TaxID=545 RepID=UPI001907A005|nr:hypothetical protein [Citrobacter koseri]MBJ8809841.1 hypothetical protein [Citrobacter koseri]
MVGTIEISDGGVAVTTDSGGKIVMGRLDGDSAPKKTFPPLTPEEEIYGRGFCLLPAGWEVLSDDDRWQNHLSDSLRQLWPSFNREQKMAIAYTISELSDELTNITYEHTW